MMNNFKRIVKRAMGQQGVKKLEVTGKIAPRISRTKGTPTRRFNGVDLDEIDQKIEPVKGLVFRGFHVHDRVLIKINVNAANPYPASTDLAMLEWVVKQLRKRGIHRIILGDCSTKGELPTRKLMKEAGLYSHFGDQVEYACFDDLEWVRVNSSFSFLSDLVVPRLVNQVDKIIYMANLKPIGR